MPRSGTVCSSWDSDRGVCTLWHLSAAASAHVTHYQPNYQGESMPRTRELAALLVLAVVGLGGCGSSGDDAPADESTPAVIDIEITEQSVSPNGERVEVAVGQRVDLVVKADAPGEIHVHTRPEEQEFGFEPGTTTFKLVIDSPGVVEVEAHDLGRTIVQLEVR